MKQQKKDVTMNAVYGTCEGADKKEQKREVVMNSVYGTREGGNKMENTSLSRSRMWTVVLLLLVACHGFGTQADEVLFTQIRDAEERGAVCLDGSPAGYNLALGHGDGAKSWIVYLKGGGWCPDLVACQANRTSPLGSTRQIAALNLTGILNGDREINPDFYNWNRAYVAYCDQASFLGDTEIDGQGPQLQFRGSRIFRAIIDDLLAQGLKWADNAILAGRSAGGLATILHCDDFRASLPFVDRVKCIADAGMFIRGKDLPNADYREGQFSSVIKFHDISSFLPFSCTFRNDPNLCLFPEYLVGDIETPLFLLNSAFDFYQLQNLLIPPNSTGWIQWRDALGNLQNSTPGQKQLIKDYYLAFVNTLMSIPDNPSRGMFIYPCLVHSVTTAPSDKQSTINRFWNANSTIKLQDMNMVQAVSEWYFDRNPVKLIKDAHFPEC